MAASGAAVAAPPELPKPGQVKGTSKKVPASLLGMHVHSLTSTAPTVEDRFGGIRIWDNGVRWDSYLDLVKLEGDRKGNWAGCEKIHEAVQVVKSFLSSGRGSGKGTRAWKKERGES
jgi:hypothetical protein